MTDLKHAMTLIIGGASYDTFSTRKFRSRQPYSPADPRLIHCVIPGVIRTLYVGRGARVKVNDRLLMLEAMKMQNDICAHRDGTVRAIHVAEGDVVVKGELLIEID